MSGPTVDAEILRLVRARLPGAVAPHDARDALEALREAPDLSGGLYAVARELRVLSRAIAGDDRDANDDRDTLDSAACRLEALADLAELLDAAHTIALATLEEAGETEAAE